MMKPISSIFAVLLIFSALSPDSGAQQLSAREIIRKADEKFNGEK